MKGIQDCKKQPETRKSVSGCFLSPDFNNGFHNLRFVADAGIHGVLNIVQIEEMGGQMLQIDLPGSHGVDGHGIDMAVTENRLNGQLFVRGKAGGKGHLAGSAVAYHDNGAALFHHLDTLADTGRHTGGIQHQVTARSPGLAEHFLNRIPMKKTAIAEVEKPEES